MRQCFLCQLFSSSPTIRKYLLIPCKYKHSYTSHSFLLQMSSIQGQWSGEEWRSTSPCQSHHLAGCVAGSHSCLHRVSSVTGLMVPWLARQERSWCKCMHMHACAHVARMEWAGLPEKCSVAQKHSSVLRGWLKGLARWFLCSRKDGTCMWVTAGRGLSQKALCMCAYKVTRGIRICIVKVAMSKTYRANRLQIPLPHVLDAFCHALFCSFLQL